MKKEPFFEKTDILLTIFAVIVIACVGFFAYEQHCIGEHCSQAIDTICTKIPTDISKDDGFKQISKIIDVNISKLQDTLTLLVGVITVTFVLFSFLGLMKIEENLRTIKNAKQEYTLKIEENRSIQERNEIERLLLKNIYNLELIKEAAKNRESCYYLYAKARCCINQQKYDEAKEILEEIIKENEIKGDVDVLIECNYYLSKACFYLENYNEAEKYVNKALELLGKYVDIEAREEDNKYIVDTQLPEAQRRYSRCYLLLGRIYFSQYNNKNKDEIYLNKALKNFGEALNLDRHNPDLLVWLASVYKKKKMFKEAFQILKTLIAENSAVLYYQHELADTYYHYGLFWKEQNNALGAKISFEKIIKIYDTAEKKFTLLNWRAENIAGFYYFKGLAYIELERYNQAIISIRLSVGIPKPRSYYFFDLGKAYYYNKDYEEAIRQFKNAIEKKQKPNYMFFLGLSYLYLNKPKVKESVDALIKTLEIEEEIEDYYYTHLIALLLLSKDNKAKKYFSRFKAFINREIEDYDAKKKAYRLLTSIRDIINHEDKALEIESCDETNINGLISFVTQILNDNRISRVDNETKGRIEQILPQYTVSITEVP